MRAFLAMLQLLLLGLPTLAAVTALRAGPEANLPACCRRAGAHHCAMRPGQIAALQQAWTGAESGVQVGAIAERCPCYPKAVPSAQHSPAAPAAGAAIFGQVLSHPAGHAQTQAKFRIARDRSRQKRGPPSLS